MFEDCVTLAQLNQARVVAAGEYDIVEVNNAYNQQRQKILRSRPIFTPMTMKKVPTIEQQMTVSLIYKGTSSRPGVIEIKSDGVYA